MGIFHIDQQFGLSLFYSDKAAGLFYRLVGGLYTVLGGLKVIVYLRCDPGYRYVGRRDAYCVVVSGGWGWACIRRGGVLLGRKETECDRGRHDVCR